MARGGSQLLRKKPEKVFIEGLKKLGYTTGTNLMLAQINLAALAFSAKGRGSGIKSLKMILGNTQELRDIIAMGRKWHSIAPRKRSVEYLTLQNVHAILKVAKGIAPKAKQSPKSVVPRRNIRKSVPRPKLKQLIPLKGPVYLRRMQDGRYRVELARMRGRTRFRKVLPLSPISPEMSVGQISAILKKLPGFIDKNFSTIPVQITRNPFQLSVDMSGYAWNMLAKKAKMGMAGH